MHMQTLLFEEPSHLYNESPPQTVVWHMDFSALVQLQQCWHESAKGKRGRSIVGLNCTIMRADELTWLIVKAVTG